MGSCLDKARWAGGGGGGGGGGEGSMWIKWNGERDRDGKERRAVHLSDWEIEGAPSLRMRLKIYVLRLRSVADVSIFNAVNASDGEAHGAQGDERRMCVSL